MSIKVAAQALRAGGHASLERIVADQAMIVSPMKGR